ncbi:hypothetical protein ACHHYP_12569 [Achlya hypogyna]|uniref:Uncharacterized protein n=1 Tax=Achlya hypogyna TaxID=1202772 RepID=A0A1V9YGQ6_ACHHY|nr:hypothetical protein ACHHYP_12569 [Achlya hypogyna]
MVASNLWDEVADESGRIFYVNRATSETLWELPPGGLLASQVPPAEVQLAAPPLEVVARAVEIRQRLLGAPSSAAPVWLLAFDPAARRPYFLELPTGAVAVQAPDGGFRTDDALVTWWLTVQCAVRAALARRRVGRRRFLQRFPPVPRPAILLALTPETETQREADDRRGLLAAERAQCARGDRFWGIDQRVREIRRQQLEESMMREAEDMRRKLTENARRREETLRKAAEEQERKRRSEDSLIETHERQAMQHQEFQQCKVDTFWGVQKQESDERFCQEQMTMEDAASLRHATELWEAQLHARWAMDAARALELEKKKRLGEEIKFQKQYLKVFRRAKTSEAVIKYRWPTQAVVELEARRGVPATDDVAYNLDVVLDPARQANPKHIFHTASSSHTVGRKGKLDISHPPASFHLAQPSPHPTKPSPHQRASANGLAFRVPESAGMAAALARPLEKPRKIRLPSIVSAPSNQQPETAPIASPEDDAIDVASLHEQFAAEEAVLLKIFELIDTDHGGSIDKNEMIWALTRDAMVHKLAMDSVVFRDVLKKRNLEGLFEDMDESQTGDVPWGVFRAYCEKTFVSLALEAERKRRAAPPPVQLTKEELLKKRNAEYQARKAILDQEEAIAKLVFALVDTDHSGTIDQNEMIRALELNEHVRGFVQRSRGLRPLLTNPTFAKAFIGMATDVDKGMGLEEFMCFCTEIASVAMLNGMVPT